MLIRTFRAEDAFEVSSVIRRAAMERDNRSYTLEQLYSFANHYSADFIIESCSRRMIYVYVDNGKVIGTGALEGDEIATLFILPEYQGKGLGKKFMDFLEELALEKGLKRVWVLAVLSAVSFYEKIGYKFVSDEFHKKWGAGKIMEKYLC